ncbi:MAG: hypothetical protein GXX82_03895 [Syntrophorhabdus sp.]|jgi:hypothetical protein|nr:hypothetical protein [Syntrophorhabdus sp.]
MVEEEESVSFDRRMSGTRMGSRTGKAKKLVSAARAVKAVTTLAVVVVPVAATVGAIVGYGAYTLVKKLKHRS